jgi:hypothetical protein
MGDLFNEQSLLTIRLNTDLDLAGASVTKILVLRPDRSKVEWLASADGRSLMYDVAPGDIDQTGLWQFQAYVEFGGRKGFGKIVSRHFLKHI